MSIKKISSVALVALIDGTSGRIVKVPGTATEFVGVFDLRDKEYAGGFDRDGICYGSDIDTDDTVMLFNGKRSQFKVGEKYRIARSLKNEQIVSELVKTAKALLTADARSEYAQAMRAARRSLSVLSKKLDVHEREQQDDPDNYGGVGDLGHINEELNELIRFLGV